MATRLRNLKDSQALSYEKFGEIAGVSAQSVMKWLKGGDAKEINLIKLAKHFGVNAAWIRYGDIDPKLLSAKGAAGYGESLILLSPIARDIAAKWNSLSADRQEWFRDLLFTTHWMEKRFPAMRKGRPRGESYDALEAAFERDFRQLKLKLE